MQLIVCVCVKASLCFAKLLVHRYRNIILQITPPIIFNK